MVTERYTIPLPCTHRPPAAGVQAVSHSCCGGEPIAVDEFLCALPRWGVVSNVWCIRCPDYQATPEGA